MVLALAHRLDRIRLNAGLVKDGHDLAGRRAHVLVERRTLTVLLLKDDPRALTSGLVAERGVSFALEGANLRNVDSLANQAVAARAEHLTEVEVVLDVLLQANFTPISQLVAERVVGGC